jgi:tetratricopeptide (TPR) repeat protein
MPNSTTTTAAQAAAHSKNPHKLVKHQDAFLASGKKWANRLSQQTGLLAVLGAGAVLLVAASLLWMNRREERENQARDALYGALQTLETEMKAVALELAPPKPDASAKDKKKAPEPPAPGPEAVAYRRFDVDKKLSGALAALGKVAEAHAGTRASTEALLKSGDLHLRHGSSEKALEAYLKATKQARGSLEKAFAWYSAGAAYENLGKAQDAVAAYEKAWAVGEKPLDGEVGLALARAQLTSGKADAARATYDKLIQERAGTEYAQTAETLKAKLQ